MTVPEGPACDCGLWDLDLGPFADDDWKYDNINDWRPHRSTCQRRKWLLARGEGQAVETRSESKYGSPEKFAAKLHDDEPWFALRGQDVLAPAAIQAYADYLHRVGREEQAREVEAIGIAFLRWQGANKDRVKLPD